MASLERPLTVIGGGSGDHDVDPAADADHRFAPPAATWYDECHQHFVALLEKQKKRRSKDGFSLSLSSLATSFRSPGGSDNTGGDVVYYRTLSMPARQSTEFERDSIGEGGGDAFEEVLNKFKGERQSLVGSKPVSVVLPHELAVQPPGEDDQSASSSSPGMRIPTLAKFSLDSQLLALQFTDAMVRIARVAEGDSGVGGGGTASQQKQWTIDLTVDSTPVSTAAESMPPPRRPGRMGKQTPRRAGSFGGSSSKDDGVIPGETKILPGGVIWSDHGGNSEDLILVTTTSVLFYKISMQRNHMAKSRGYPHPFVAGFWFEPKARALMVGSYKVQKDAKKEVAVGASSAAGCDSLKREAGAPPMVMVMRTYFLNRPPKIERSESSSSLTSQPSPSTSFSGESRGPASYYSFPRFELPPPERLKPFIVGGERNTVEDAPLQRGEGKPSKVQSSHEQVVSLEDIHLLNVYGDVYCVELGCFGDGVGVNLFHLDKRGGCVSVKQIIPRTFLMPSKSQPGSNFVSVLDNLICIHSKSSRSSLFLDVANTSDSDPSQDTGRIIVSDDRPGASSIFDESFSFLPPCFLLNPQGRGHLHRMSLNLPLLLKAMPPSRAVLPLLLRRKSSPAIAHALALRHLNDVVIDDFYNSTDEQSSELKIWIDSIAGCYALNERVATAWDLEACQSLIFKAAVLKANPSQESNEVMHNADLSRICSRTPSRCASIVTQSELLEGLLIPRATVAISAKDMNMLRYILDLSVLFLGSFEERSIIPCPALECLIVALSWRLGDFDEVNSMLCSRKIYRAVQKSKLVRLSTNEVDGEQKVTSALEDAMNAGLDMFAEMLLMLSKEEVTLQSCSGGSKKQLKAALVRHAIDMLCSTESYQLAAKHLLAMDRVMEAMTVCSRAVSLHSLRPSQRDPHQSPLPSHGMRADDFFRAAVNESSALPGIGDRVRLFFFMHTFIKEYDPDVLQLETRPIITKSTQQQTGFSGNTPHWRSSFASGAGDPHKSLSRRRSSAGSKNSEDYDQQPQEIEQSILAHNYGSFPNHLFGGRKGDVCRQLRDMFGFSEQV